MRIQFHSHIWGPRFFCNILLAAPSILHISCCSFALFVPFSVLFPQKYNSCFPKLEGAKRSIEEKKPNGEKKNCLSPNQVVKRKKGKENTVLIQKIDRRLQAMSREKNTALKQHSKKMFSNWVSLAIIFSNPPFQKHTYVLRTPNLLHLPLAFFRVATMHPSLLFLKL